MALEEQVGVSEVLLSSSASFRVLLVVFSLFFSRGQDQNYLHCRIQWYKRMYVYKQLFVWLWRALHLSDSNYVYLLALLAATNGLIM